MGNHPVIWLIANTPGFEFNYGDHKPETRRGLQYRPVTLGFEFPVIPANAGIHGPAIDLRAKAAPWIPAFAGMTTACALRTGVYSTELYWARTPTSSKFKSNEQENGQPHASALLRRCFCWLALKRWQPRETARCAVTARVSCLEPTSRRASELPSFRASELPSFRAAWACLRAPLPACAQPLAPAVEVSRIHLVLCLVVPCLALRGSGLMSGLIRL